MYKLARPLFLHCLSPLHAGTGSDLGYIDLPIQREKHTGFPKVEASSLKGALREVFEGNDDDISATFGQGMTVNFKKNGAKNSENIDLSFGPEQGDSHAGALGFTDARLLLFPVKSLKGIFAWVTCPEIIEKFKKELEEVCGLTNKISNTSFSVSEEEALIVGTDLVIQSANKIVLEEYTFKADKATENAKVTTLATELHAILGIEGIQSRLVILHKNTFTDFVKLHTEVISRIVLNKQGTTDNLFNEEFLPAESVLYSLVLASPIFKEKDADKGIFKENGGIEKDYQKLMKYFELGLKDVFQLGGDATLGKGITRTIKKLLKV